MRNIAHAIDAKNDSSRVAPHEYKNAYACGETYGIFRTNYVAHSPVNSSEIADAYDGANHSLRIQNVVGTSPLV
jgi:hypothetical protein